MIIAATPRSYYYSMIACLEIVLKGKTVILGLLLHHKIKVPWVYSGPPDLHLICTLFSL